ncbi:nickel-dependent lactate racemase [Blastopirellula sp. J2-11]|uniref:nickel-dependent lactate racemase n=1 Tax=Blastopirellula sp. J2-11 TaxID=2943192 RepID=UPI0021CA21B7|nr:nickel-dependent lactate racemase [Blastopirellula sp. J2-11]UUO08238.1 nickel-dependent lactate racemase [Blastopirellula sp. J2-11]
MPWISEQADSISWDRIEAILQQTVAEARQRICATPRRVLLLPPDITRMHSGSGQITEMLYNMLAGEADVHVIPTLGQHVPHTPEENVTMFGSIPEEKIHPHDWRGGCVQIGEISAAEVSAACGGIADWPIPITLNRMLMEEPWDLIINIGHVVPHEVLGFANHNKNYFIGLGGKDLICAAHLMAARCGIENNLGNLITPVRHCFNLAEERYLSKLPDLYVQVVMARNDQDQLVHTGVYVGDDLDTYLDAAKQSREQNITVFDKPIQKMVCVMQGDEFFSTWVANKAVYRTRMVMADGGELLILAPGLKRFGEQDDVDALIRKYGYCGTDKVMADYQTCEDLQELAHGAAHLMHGSSEGRFKITYAPGHLGKEEMESVHFGYADLNEMMKRYQPGTRREGWNKTDDGEEFYFIPTPSAGLWSTRERLYDRATGFNE